MDSSLDEVVRQLDQLEGAQNDAMEPVDDVAVRKALSDVEAVWGKELNKLKQELHQTIFAHNHNADLMKQQKEVLEQITKEVKERAPPSSERVKAAKTQLAKVDQLLKATAKQQKL